MEKIERGIVVSCQQLAFSFQNIFHLDIPADAGISLNSNPPRRIIFLLFDFLLSYK